MTSAGETKVDIMKEEEGEEVAKQPAAAEKKMRKRLGFCSLYSCKEEEAEEAKKTAMSPAKKKKKKKKCSLESCKTKLGLTAYQCRCGRFLFSHFFFTSHHCVAVWWLIMVSMKLMRILMRMKMMKLMRMTRMFCSLHTPAEKHWCSFDYQVDHEKYLNQVP